MRDNTKKKAPKVPIPPRDKPFAYEKESDKTSKKKNPMAPLAKKRLTK